MLTFIENEYERFLREDDGKPVTMLNLLRFDPDGGRERYDDYIRMAVPLLARYGAEVIYAGEGLAPLSAEEGQAWDSVVLVRYPNRQAFASLAADPDYTSTAGPARESSLIEAVLQPLRTTS
jgi:uncharacterized protein (DUF1330 family)